MGRSALIERIITGTLTIDWDAFAVSALTVLVALAIAYVAYLIVFKIIGRLAHLSEIAVDEILVKRIRQPIKWSFLAISVTIAAQYDPELRQWWEPLARFLRPALLGWIAYNVVRGLTAAMELRMADADPVATRSRRTRVAVLSRIVVFAIVVITVGLMLFSIPSVRAIGTTMLASAGLAALAIGAAAQPALKSLIAGVQVALTEPMRIGDLVKVDGDTGRVEEIHMSFVTVRTWDDRVLVVPTSRFLDETFENWSRLDETLTGTVFMHLDPITDVAPIRAEFERYVETHELFDGRNHGLAVTEAYPESLELRIVVSAENPGDLWTLRCDVREHMMAWLRENMEEVLIRHRLEVPHGHPKAGEP
ncbi:small-conductance mechanosensitive channel [Erythrobacter sp. NAP1]|uniref:mechanosensitive ion channel family protein n=1 Tax=Erythrobacter sp. NAP1 TaxID=237727 RepID=UPI000068793B|nr:mechanosensitive ion channel domain-containing protein [Erythrobacter sp. NAP1]EAQ28280.1 small-conductance mechanosensitive channel [Erythrobacter sp. NAP1]